MHVKNHYNLNLKDQKLSFHPIVETFDPQIQKHIVPHKNQNFDLHLG